MKNKIFVLCFLIILYGFMMISIFDKNLEVSYNERRQLATVPRFEFSTKLSNKVEKYLLDHFPLRDEFRKIKGLFNYKVLFKLENNDVYFKDNYVFKSMYPTNKKSIENYNKYLDKMNSLFTENNNVYLMIIPDKNYYLNDENFLNIDYDYLYDSVGVKYNKIDIRDVLTLEDYYYTDTHWRQENLDKVVKKIDYKMSFGYKDVEYKSNYYDKFYGIYYGESLNSKPDKINYLTNEVIDNSRVFYLENKDLTSVYNPSKLTGMDSYDVYLDGASSYIEIFNNKCDNDKELVIFRDSFGSSISPLFINYYFKITIIDNRYISNDYFKKYIEFDDQDILIMNSTMVINDSFTLKN